MGRFTRGDPASVVGVISGAHFVSHVYLLAYPPLFALLAAEFGATATQLGLLVTAIYLPTLVLQIPLGHVVDRIGAKWILVGGLLVTSVAIALSGLATTYWLLLACALLSGVGQSVFHPADYAVLDAVSDPSTEGRAFGAHTFGGFAGFAAAPVFVGGLGIATSWQLALLVVGGAGVLYTVFLVAVLEPVHAQTLEGGKANEGAFEPEAALREMTALVSGPLVLVFCFYLLTMMAIVGLQSFTTVLGTDAYGFGDATANTLLTVHLTATAIGILLGGPLADRLPFRRVLVGSLSCCAVGVWIAAVGVGGGGNVVGPSNLSGIVAPAVVLAAAGLALGAALPARDKFANSMADPNATGRSFGFFFTGLSLGAVIAPVLLGAVIDASSATLAFVLVGAVLVAAAAIVGVAGSDSHRSEGWPE